MAVHYTKAEVADIIEAFLDGTRGRWDWDDFTSLRIADPEPEGFAEVRRMVERLRADASGEPADT